LQPVTPASAVFQPIERNSPSLLLPLPLLLHSLIDSYYPFPISPACTLSCSNKGVEQVLRRIVQKAVPLFFPIGIFLQHSSSRTKQASKQQWGETRASLFSGSSCSCLLRGQSPDFAVVRSIDAVSHAFRPNLFHSVGQIEVKWVQSTLVLVGRTQIRQTDLLPLAEHATPNQPREED